VDVSARDRWVFRPAATGTYQSLPVRAGLAGTRVAAAELPRAAGYVFAVSGYQECEDQPLLEFINGVADSVVPMRPAYSSRVLRSVAGWPATCVCNPIYTVQARPWLVTITLQIRMFGARPSRRTFLGRGETRGRRRM